MVKARHVLSAELSTVRGQLNYWKKQYGAIQQALKEFRRNTPNFIYLLPPFYTGPLSMVQKNKLSCYAAMESRQQYIQARLRETKIRYLRLCSLENTNYYLTYNSFSPLALTSHNSDDFTEELDGSIVEDEEPIFCKKCNSWRLDLMPCQHMREPITPRFNKRKYMALQEMRASYNNKMRKIVTPAQRNPALQRLLRLFITGLEIMRLPLNSRFAQFSKRCWPVGLLLNSPTNLIDRFLRSAKIRDGEYYFMTGDNKYVYEEIPLTAMKPSEQVYVDHDDRLRTMAPTCDAIDAMVELDEKQLTARAKFNRWLSNKAVPEMDREDVKENVLLVNKTSNVVLTEEKGSSSDITTMPQPSWLSFCSADVNPDYATVTNRWLQINTLEWTTSQMAGSVLTTLVLPKLVITKEQLGSACRMPNLMAFNVHRYWRGDIEVKLQVNCNRFQVGSLQMAWLYCPHFDQFALDRFNIYSLSQTNHAIVTANASNEACLRIPYKYYLPLLHTKARSDMPDPLNMGSLIISVINPLTVPSGGPTTANMSLFVRFIDSEFTGMLAGNIDALPNIAEPEMERACNAVLSGLNTFMADPNRDNPPAIGAPRYLVPTAAHSWSIGTNIVEPLHALRLDAKGQTPHPPGASPSNEMSIKFISRVFGLVKTIEWSKEHITGQIIDSFDAAPILSRDNYTMFPGKGADELNSFALPPVAVAASMFMGWRGSLEFRFDVVASQYHTGRLMLAYVPGASKSTTMTLAHLRASTNVVYTLNDSTQFTFTVPYIANKPAWPRRYGGDFRPTDNLSPSRVYLCVINQLIPMQNVSDRVYLNMYMRAGPDFELVVPIQPSLGLAFNRQYIVKNNKPSKIKALSGYYPYYSGKFEDLEYGQCFRWGTLSHQIAKFSAGNWYDSSTGNVTYCTSQNSVNLPMYADEQGKMVLCTTAVFIYLDQLGYVIGIPTRNEVAAQKLAINLFALKIPLNHSSNNAYLISQAWGTTNNTYTTPPDFNCVWDTKYVKVPNKTEKFVDHDFEFVPAVGRLSVYPEGERDTTENILGLGEVRSTNSGSLLYGENFNDLKNLLRRYQLYGYKLIPTVDKKDAEMIKFSFPCLPQGLYLNVGDRTNINELFNRARDGHIPLIASGYRFFRGGLRYRLIFDSDPDISVYIQHRPDRLLTEQRIQDQGATITGESVVNHTYASYIQLTAINGVVEFEVPYYMLGLYGLLQTPQITKTDESGFFSLGEISIGIILSNLDNIPKKMVCSIYYSIADDMNFSTFQGFPPTVFCSDVPQGLASPEGLFDFFTAPVETVTSNIASNIRREIHTSSQGLAEAIREKINDLDMHYRDAVIKMALSIAHTFVDQTPTTLVLSLMSVLLEMKILVLDNLKTLVDSLVSAVTTWVSRVSRERIQETTRIPTARPEMMLSSFQPGEWVKVLSLIFVGICATVGISCAPPTNMKSFANIFTQHIPNSVRAGNFIMVFLNGILDIVKRFLFWIMRKMYPVESFYYSMESELPDVKLWVNEVQFLVRQNLTNVLDSDGYWMDRVVTAVDFGHRLIERCVDAGDKQVHLIFKIQDKIEKLYEKLEAMGKHPFVRREPFCIWVSGTPGIGKSFLMEFLSSQLLKSINYVTRGPKTYTVMPATDFWTGCRDQPVLNLDDAFSVELGETLEKQLNIMYMVKSPVALNPPMASLEDKHLRYNPELLYVNSNKSYLNIPGLDPSAIHRRRDILIEAKCDNSIQKDNTFSHLRFNILNPLRPSVAPLAKDLTYAELLHYIIPKYKSFYDQEMENYYARLRTYDDIMTAPGDDLREVTSLRDQMYNDRREMEIKYIEDKRNALCGRVTQFCKQSYKLAHDHCVTNLGKLWPSSQITVPEMNKPEPEMLTLGQIYKHEHFDDIASPEISNAGSYEAEDADFISTQRELHKKLNPEDIPDNPLEGSSIREETKQARQRIYDMYSERNFEASLVEYSQDAPYEIRIKNQLHYKHGVPFDVINEIRPNLDMIRQYLTTVTNVDAPWKNDGFFTAKSVDFYLLYKQVLTMEERSCLETIFHKSLYEAYRNKQREALHRSRLNATSFKTADFIDRILDNPKHEQATSTENKCMADGETNTTPFDLISLASEHHRANASIDLYFHEALTPIRAIYKFSEADIEYLRFTDCIDSKFNAVNIHHISLTTRPKFYFYNKPWLVWELFADDTFGRVFPNCIHVNSKLHWDYDDCVWKLRDNSTAITNIRHCGDQHTKCALELDHIAKLFYHYHIFNTSQGRQFVKQGRKEKLPVYFTNELDSISQLATTWFDTFQVKLQDYIKNSVVPNLWACAKYFLYLGASFGTIGLVTWVFKWITTKCLGPATVVPPSVTDTPAENKILNLSVAEKAYTNELKFTQPKVSINSLVRAEGPDANYNNIIRKINNNSFIITAETVVDGIIRTNRGRGLGIRGHQGLFIRHYHEQFMSLPSSTRFYLERMQQGNLGPRVEINYHAFQAIPFVTNSEDFQTNFFVLQFPNYMPFFKDITNNIARVQDHNHVGTRGDLISFGSGVVMDLNLSMQYGLQIGGEGAIEPINCYSVYAYHHHGSGVCGSTLMARNVPNSPIIGLHVAGLNGTGFSEPIFREMFKDVPQPVIAKFEELDLESPDAARVTIRTTVLPLGVAEPQMEHRETGKTQYIKSLIHGIFPVDTEPNPLSPSDPRIKGNSPMQLGCEKHGMPVRPFDLKEVEVAKFDLQNVILSSIPARVTGTAVWSLQDAICGNSLIPHCEPLDWGTSPGVGYEECRKGHKGKRFLFDLQETSGGLLCNGIHAKLKNIMQHKLELRKQNIVPTTIFTDCLKDTCLSIAKCRIPGKTRIFSISPVDFTIQFRQYFGDFMAGYTAARFNVESAIGINVDGPEWSELAYRMSRLGPHIVDGDYSNFGPGLSLQLVQAAFDIILKWYSVNGASLESQQIRKVMIQEFLNAPHMCFNLLYQVYSGIPSGSPITTILNSMVNSLLIRMAWLSICTEQNYLTMSAFHKYVRIVTYGDDVFLNVDAKVIESFNLQTLINYFKTKNIVFTNSSKDTTVYQSTTLDKIQFLSRGFKLHPTRRLQYLAPLKESSIHSCINWIHRKGDALQNTIQNCDMALVLAYGHGETYYNDIKDKLLLALAKLNVKWSPKTYYEMDVSVWETPSDFKSVSFPIFDFVDM